MEPKIKKKFKQPFMKTAYYENINKINKEFYYLSF